MSCEICDYPESEWIVWCSACQDKFVEETDGEDET